MPADSARQLLQATSLTAVLRLDAEQAERLAEAMPDALPASLRSELRHVIDRNLGYSELQSTAAASIARRLDASVVERSLSWWTSPAGRQIFDAESGAYASLYPGTMSDLVSGLPSSPLTPDAGERREVGLASGFAGYIGNLRQATGSLGACLYATVSLGPACASPQASGSGDDDDRSRIVARLSEAIDRGYSRVGQGTLESYRGYLRSGDVGALETLRKSVFEAEVAAWRNAIREASAAIDQFAQTELLAKKDLVLRQVIADIDASRRLSESRVTLELLRRAGLNEVSVFLQLARVEIKQSPNRAISASPPAVPDLEPRRLDAAQGWLDQALALDPRRAETLILCGHVAYLKRQFQRSVDLLEQARAIGTDSPWLPMNMGDALWAMGANLPDHTLAKRAAAQYESALRMKLPPGAEARAVHQLSGIYAETGALAKADVYYRRVIDLAEGRYKAAAFHRYGQFLLYYVHDVDGALRAARRAVQIQAFPLARELLAETLIVKGGNLHLAGHASAAHELFMEAARLEPDLESLAPGLARVPDATFAGLAGLHAEGLLNDFSGSIGGRTLVMATLRSTGPEIEQLLAWGANPNYLDPSEGTPLHEAILAHNVPAVRVLLAHGADPLTPFLDGRTPSQLIEAPAGPRQVEIATLIRQAAAAHAHAPEVAGVRLKAGYVYLLKKPLVTHGFGTDHAAGERLLFEGECKFKYSDESLACLVFRSPADAKYAWDSSLPKDALGRWADWFEEIGPARPPTAAK